MLVLIELAAQRQRLAKAEAKKRDAEKIPGTTPGKFHTPEWVASSKAQITDSDSYFVLLYRTMDLK